MHGYRETLQPLYLILLLPNSVCTKWVNSKKSSCQTSRIEHQRLENGYTRYVAKVF